MFEKRPQASFSNGLYFRVLPKERIATAAVQPFLRHQQIERKTCEVVGHGLHLGILFLVENLAVRMALATRLRSNRRRAALDRLVGDAFVRQALTAGDPHHVPLGGTKSAMQISIPLRPLVRPDDT